MEMTEDKVLVRELGFIPCTKRGVDTDSIMWDFIQGDDMHTAKQSVLRPLRYGIIEALGKNTTGAYKLGDRVVFNVNQGRFVDTGSNWRMSIREARLYGKIV
jgi:hypothetical protein